MREIRPDQPAARQVRPSSGQSGRQMNRASGLSGRQMNRTSGQTGRQMNHGSGSSGRQMNRTSGQTERQTNRSSGSEIRLPDFSSRRGRMETEDWQPIRYERESWESQTGRPVTGTKERQEPETVRRVPVKKKKSGKRKKSIAFRILLVVLFVAAIVSGAYAGKIGFLLDDTLNHLNRSSGVDLSTVEVSKNIEHNNEIINILLVGSDKRRDWAETGRSDSAMIATLDTKHNQLKLTSLMRDMYLPIPGHGENRFNAAYSFGGVELLYQTVAENFEVSVDGYAVVDFYTFCKVINELGGVKIKLTDEEYRYLVSAYPQKEWSHRLKPGKNHMSGAMALAYCRIRQDAQGDFGRTARQRNVLNAILKKAKKLSLSELLELAEKIVPEISTDLTNEEIISYMKTILFMGTTKIHQFRLPVDGSYTPQIIYGMDVLVTDVEQNREALQDFIENKVK